MMYVLRSCQFKSTIKSKQGSLPSKRCHNSRPQDHCRCDTIRVLPVYRIRRSILAEQSAGFCAGDAGDEGTARCYDDLRCGLAFGVREEGRADGECNSIRERHKRHNHRAYLPRQLHRSAFMPLRPKQIKEESRPEDCRYSNADKDIIRKHRDNVIIMRHCLSIGSCRDAILLIYIVY
jgi:hypothetical protein